MDIPQIDKKAKLKIDDVVPMVEEIPLSEKKSILMFVMGTVVMILVVTVVLVVGYVFINQTKPKNEVAVVSPSPVPTEVPKITLDKSAVVFEVLNGSGVKGAGAAGRSKIQALGYEVPMMGNATGKHVGTELYLSDSVILQKELLLDDLKADYPNIVYVGELKDSTVSARLIIGK